LSGDQSTLKPTLNHFKIRLFRSILLKLVLDAVSLCKSLIFGLFSPIPVLFTFSPFLCGAGSVVCALPAFSRNLHCSSCHVEAQEMDIHCSGRVARHRRFLVRIVRPPAELFGQAIG